MGAGESFDIPPAATLAAQYEAARPAREESAAKNAEDPRLREKKQDAVSNKMNINLLAEGFKELKTMTCGPCVAIKLHRSSNRPVIIDALRREQYVVKERFECEFITGLCRDDVYVCLPCATELR